MWSQKRKAKTPDPNIEQPTMGEENDNSNPNADMEHEVAEVEVTLAPGDDEQADGDLEEVISVVSGATGADVDGNNNRSATVNNDVSDENQTENKPATSDEIIKDLAMAHLEGAEPKDLEEDAPTEIDEEDVEQPAVMKSSNVSKSDDNVQRRSWLAALGLVLCLALCALAVVLPSAIFNNRSQQVGITEDENTSGMTNDEQLEPIVNVSDTEEASFGNATGSNTTTGQKPLITLVPTMSPTTINQLDYTASLSCPFQGSGWTKVDQDIVGESAGDFSGGSVAISADGSIVAIGAAKNTNAGTGWAGHVRTFKLSEDGVWMQLGSDIDGAASNDEFGGSVSLSANGKRLAVGARWNQDTGHARVYEFDEATGEWSQLGLDVMGEASGDQHGRSVALSAVGNVLAVGATSNDGFGVEDSGAVRVYEFDGEEWAQMGQDIDGDAARDRMGISVSLSSDGSILAVGGYLSNALGQEDAGMVRMYTYDIVTASWVPYGQDIVGKAAGDWTGMSVSLSWDGSRVAVGSPGDNDRYLPGVAQVYELVNGTTWSAFGEPLNKGGYSVSLSKDGTRVAVGDHKGVNNGNDSGHTTIFELENDMWIQVGNQVNGQAGELSGTSVALSADGQRVIISAPLHANDGEANVGVARVYDFC